MDAKFIVEPFDRQRHSRATFSSGVAPLDTYLKERAGQEAKKNVASIYVLCERGSSAIIGYYTISAASIEAVRLPEAVTKRLPKYNTLPAMLIGRLAVDQNYQGQGLGERLLANALRRCLRISQEIGAMAVIVDAKDERIAQFCERHGFQRFVDKPLSLYIPIEAIQQFA